MEITFTALASFILVMTVALGIIFGAWYVAEKSNEQKQLLESRHAFITVGDTDYQCERIEYRGINLRGYHLLTCVGADEWKS